MVSDWRIKQMIIEWKIMKSVLNHCGADVSMILSDLKSPSIDEIEIFEGIAVLMTTEILEFSLQHRDFIFTPETAGSPLTRALKSSTPPISEEDYMNYGWRKLAGLGMVE